MGLTPLEKWLGAWAGLVKWHWSLVDGWTIVVDPTSYIGKPVPPPQSVPSVCYQLVFFSLNIDTTILYKIKDWVVDWFVYQPSAPSWLWVLPSDKSFFFATLLSHCPFSFPQSKESSLRDKYKKLWTFLSFLWTFGEKIFRAHIILHQCSSSVKRLPFWNLGFHKELSKCQEWLLASPADNTIHPKIWQKVQTLPWNVAGICGLTSTAVEADL